MVENFEAIENLTKEDVEFAKRIIAFFKLIGISEKDVKMLFELAREKEKIVSNINKIITDQNILNARFDGISKTMEEQKGKNLGATLFQRFDPIAELNKKPEQIKKDY